VAAVTIQVTPAPFDAASELADLKKIPGVGAVVTFSGVCRDEAGRLTALEIEHYAGMAETEIAAVVEEAAVRWPLAAITVIHRVGVIPVGDDIVLVATASAHREAAFAGAEFIMDYLKTSAPFWKKEHTAGAGESQWVGSREADTVRAARWKDDPPKS
jgi:molybdopterin synthase catalytic subunit